MRAALEFERRINAFEPIRDLAFLSRLRMIRRVTHQRIPS